MSERKIKKPIIVVGAPRSGTTLLGRILAAHPDVAFWEEPRTIWEIGNSFQADDVLTEQNLTPRIGKKIDAQFSHFLKKTGRLRFAEKTPANTLRLRFVQALYPDAKIIHIIRDGRASVTSVLKMRDRPARPDRIWSRLRETPVSGYLPLLARAMRRERFLLRPSDYANFSADPVEQITQQWNSIVETTRRDLSNLPAESWIEFRYEDFVSDHQKYLARILEFCELDEARVMIEKADELVDPTRSNIQIPVEVDVAFQKFGFHESIGTDR